MMTRNACKVFIFLFLLGFAFPGPALAFPESSGNPTSQVTGGALVQNIFPPELAEFIPLEMKQGYLTVSFYEQWGTCTIDLGGGVHQGTLEDGECIIRIGEIECWWEPTEKKLDCQGFDGEVSFEVRMTNVCMLGVYKDTLWKFCPKPYESVILPHTQW